MRILLLLALCSLRLVGAVAFDNFADGGYSGSGVHTTTIVASGTNLGCIVYVWYRSGSTGTPTCGGNAMTKLTPMAATLCVSASTIDTWVYFGPGLAAGSLTVSISATVESALAAVTVNGANQTGQPDALAAFASGMTSGGNGFGLPITTVANQSLVLGAFCVQNGNHDALANGTWVGDPAAAGGVGLHIWRSTSNVNPAGAFTLHGGGTADGYAAEANGLSIAPPAALSTGNKPNPSVIVVGP